MTHLVSSYKTQEQEIEERREKVSQLLLQGFTEVLVAKELGVSRETIVRDVRVLKEEALPWFDDLAGIGFAHEAKLALDKLRQCERWLHELRDQAKTSDEKLKAIRALEENIICQSQYLANGPTVHSLNKAMKLYGTSMSSG